MEIPQQHGKELKFVNKGHPFNFLRKSPRTADESSSSFILWSRCTFHPYLHTPVAATHTRSFIHFTAPLHAAVWVKNSLPSICAWLELPNQDHSTSSSSPTVSDLRKRDKTSAVVLDRTRWVIFMPSILHKTLLLINHLNVFNGCSWEQETMNRRINKLITDPVSFIARNLDVSRHLVV